MVTVPSHTRADFLDTIALGRRPGEPNYRDTRSSGGEQPGEAALERSTSAAPAVILLECLAGWTPHRIKPYGLELVPALAELARARLPDRADRIFVGNALTWAPPRGSTSFAPSWSKSRTSDSASSSSGFFKTPSRRAAA